MKRIEAKRNGRSSSPWRNVKYFCFCSIGFWVVVAAICSLGPLSRIIFIVSLCAIIVTLFIASVNIFEMRADNKNDDEVKEVAILRRNAAGPSSALSLPAHLQDGLNKRLFKRGSIFNDSPAYYAGAAACGVSPHSYVPTTSTTPITYAGGYTGDGGGEGGGEGGVEESGEGGGEGGGGDGDW